MYIPSRLPTVPVTVVTEFKTRFAALFQPALAAYLFRRHENAPATPTREAAHRLIEEAQLFIEGAHTCGDKLRQQQPAPVIK